MYIYLCITPGYSRFKFVSRTENEMFVTNVEIAVAYRRVDGATCYLHPANEPRTRYI